MRNSISHISIGDLVQVKWRDKVRAKGIVVKLEKFDEKKWKASLLPSPPSFTIIILNENGTISHFDVWDAEEIEIIQSFKNST